MTTSNSPTFCVVPVRAAALVPSRAGNWCNTIEWKTDNLPRETVERILGAHTVSAYFAMDDRKAAISLARCKQAGWWDANEREYHAAYASLVTLLRAS